jgi:hypothetical protein
MYSLRRASLRPTAVGLLVGGLALVSASCNLGRTAPEPVATSLVVRNRSVFDVNVYTMASPVGSPMRLGTVVGASTATFPLHARDLAAGGVLVVRIHAIGSNLSWTSPGVSVGPDMLAILDVNSDPFGDCSSSNLHTILTSDGVPLTFR